MRKYKRTEQRRLDLISVNEYTISKRDEQRWSSRRSIKGTTLLHGRKNNGERGHHSGGSGSEDWGQALQHQQGDAGQKCCEPRFSLKDRREHQPRCGDEDQAKKVGDAA